MSKESGKLGIGIVGCGVISFQHARSILDTEQMELVAASSRSAENREKFSREFEVPVYPTYDELLGNDNIQAVSICTPSGTHLEYGVKAAEAGKHVIVEKPIEVSVERGQALVESCDKHGVKLAVIYQNRFSDAVMKLKKAVDSGEIGKPVMSRAAVKWFRSQDYYTKSGWRGTLDLDGGGALINQSIHTVDLLIWILGEIKSVYGMKDTLTHSGIEAEDNLVATLKFVNGSLGVFEASTSITPAQPRTIEINGSQGTALLKGDRLRLSFDDESASQKIAGNKKTEENLHTKQFKKIVQSILRDEQPPVSGEEALQSLAVVEAIYKSCRKNMPVEPGSYLPGSK